jgi:predicted Zn-dependent protease
MHRMRWRVVVVVLALGGCSMYRAQPARIMVPPVIPGVVVPATTDEASGTGAGGAGTATSAPEQPVASPRSLPVQPSRQLADGSRVPAVQGLLTTAEKERRNGRLEAASVALERAQRLAPQSALVYQRLAEIRLQQKRAAEAEQFARKGMGFANGSAAQAALWRLMAEARRQQGRLQSAQEAAARAAELEASAAEPL